MKVKCIKLYLNSVGANPVFNRDMRDFLEIGTIYLVFGLSIRLGKIYYYIFDKEHLIEVPKDLFNIMDDRVSKHWHFKEDEKETVTLWPYLFYEESFIENFAEREIKERNLFEDLRKIMEEESKWIKK